MSDHTQNHAEWHEMDTEHRRENSSYTELLEGAGWTAKPKTVAVQVREQNKFVESVSLTATAGLPNAECRCGHPESKHRMIRHADNTFPVEQCATYKCICGRFEPLGERG